MSRQLKSVLQVLILPYWKEKGPHAFLFLTLSIAFTCAVVGVLIKINYWQAEFYTALQDKNATAFFHQLGVYALLLILLVFKTIGAFYSERQLHIHWRQWLTQQFIHRWIHSACLYHPCLVKDLDNPDQRISQDIDLFCKKTIEFCLHFLNEGLKLFSFITVLWVLSGPLELFDGKIYIPGWLVWLSLIYAAIGTMITIKVGKPLITFEKSQEQVEANFRSALMQAQNQGVAVAAAQNTLWEEKNLLSKIAAVTQNYKQLIIQRLWLDIWGESFKYSTYLLPFVFTCPLYFAGKISFGQLMQLKAAYASVQYSLSLIIHQYHRIAEWKANAQRLLQFYEILNASPSKNPVTNNGDSLKAENLVLVNNGKPLSAATNFELKRGEKILLIGPNDSGKSVFFKAILGLWLEHTGKIGHPSPLLRLPQTPCLPAFLWKDFSHQEITECQKILNQLSVNWSLLTALSVQQRFCIAQLIIEAQRHRHCWIVLDNPLAFLDLAMQKIVLHLFAEQLNHCSILCLETAEIADQHHFFNKQSALTDFFRLTM